MRVVVSECYFCLCMREVCFSVYADPGHVPRLLVHNKSGGPSQSLQVQEEVLRDLKRRHENMGDLAPARCGTQVTSCRWHRFCSKTPCYNNQICLSFIAK